MFYIYDKKTGIYSRTFAKPFMQKSSQFVELTEEDFRKKVAQQAEGRNAEKSLFEDDASDDLTTGVGDEADEAEAETDGETGK